MNFRRGFAILIIALIAITTLSISQKLPGDPRPLSGLDATSIPTYKSVQAFLQASHGTSLLSGGRVVASAQKTLLGPPIPLLPLQNMQSSGSQITITRAANGTVRWMEGPLSLPQSGTTNKIQAQSAARNALAVLSAKSALLRLNNPAEELSVMSSTRDELSYQHIRFQQIYHGVPVWGRDLYVHFDSQAAVYLINGTYEPTPVNVETIPEKSAAQALQLVVADLTVMGSYNPLSAEASSFLSLGPPTKELVLFTTETGRIRLAYEVSIRPNLVEWYSYIIDAKDGRILNRIARHCSVWPHVADNTIFSSQRLEFEPPHTPISFAGSFAAATAKDLNGITQSLRVWNDGASTYYLIWDLPNIDAAKSQLPDNPTGGGLTISANSKDLDQNVQLVHNTSGNNTWSDPAAVSAHYNMKVAYDYYKNTHARKAIDDKDQSILSIVHVTEKGKGMDNAYWNGRVMAYGDGDQEFKPLAGGMDVAGHEMTHGVIQNSADLLYQNQSGALNESFADVFGVMIDRTNFLMGETIMKASTGKSALRDLSNPKSSQILSPQPASMAEFQNLSTDQDNGGVHINSGIPNKAAYNVIVAIGREKAEQIYYRALTKYLTRNSQFADCRKALEQSAKDLKGQFGITDADAAAVGTAFDGVGITATTGGTGGSGGNEVPPVSGGKQYIAFMTATGQIGLYDPTTGQAATFNSPAAAARASSSDHAQLSTGLGGQRIWFINQSRQLAYVDVVSGLVTSYPQVIIQQAGDLWNASVSPDEAYVTLASAYANDPNLYIFDGTQMAKIALDPESSQDGIKVQTIQYPDVVSWSPNMKKPKIGFDAYNEVAVGASGKVGYWSMYEIDFSSGKIYNLIGSQPSTVSIGNITYSNTNPDLIAFNYVDTTGKFDTYVGNFDTGQLKALNIPSFTLNGASVVDAERPTFSPDDAKLCFSSPTLKALLFYDGQTGKLTYAPFQTALYNPRWFVQGGTVLSSTESTQLPAEFKLFDNYPNPFNPKTAISYQLVANSFVTLRVYDVLGRAIKTLDNGVKEPGVHSVQWNGTNDRGEAVSSGVYLYQLRAGNSVMTRKMILAK